MKHKLKLLDAVETTWRDCCQCQLHVNRSKVVNWRGSPHAPLAIIGEPPGPDEDQQGLPYVGRSGRLLDDILIKAGLVPSNDVFIINSVGCSPLGGVVAKAEFDACAPRIEYMIGVVAPKALLLLGPVARKFAPLGASYYAQTEVVMIHHHAAYFYPAIVSCGLDHLENPEVAAAVLKDVIEAWRLAH